MKRGGEGHFSRMREGNDDGGARVMANKCSNIWTHRDIDREGRLARGSGGEGSSADTRSRVQGVSSGSI